jgi:hypothetical protein
VNNWVGAGIEGVCNWPGIRGHYGVHIGLGIGRVRLLDAPAGPYCSHCTGLVNLWRLDCDSRVRCSPEKDVTLVLDVRDEVRCPSLTLASTIQRKRYGLVEVHVAALLLWSPLLVSWG